MSQDLRWITAAFVLGLCAAYGLWGGRHDSALNAWTPPPMRRPLAPAVSLTESKLTLSPAKVDLGELALNETHSALVKVENVTDQPITVTEIQPSCGCISAQLSASLLPAHGSVELSVKYTALPGSRSAESTVVLTTDEAGQPHIFLPLHAQVRQDYLLEPQTLNFEQMRTHESKTLTAVVRRPDGQAFHLKSIQSGYGEFAFKWSPLPGNAFRIEATATALRPGGISDTATLLMDAPAQAALPLYLNMEVTGDVVCAPVFVVSEIGADKKAGAFEVEVWRKTPGEVVIKNVEEGAHLPLKFSTQQLAGNKMKLLIQLEFELARNFAIGDFFIQTNVEEQLLRLPYRVVQRHADAGAAK